MSTIESNPTNGDSPSTTPAKMAPPEPVPAHPANANAATPPPDPARATAGRILTRDECLAGLSQLPGLVALKLVKPAQASAMRGPFNDLLRHHERAGRSGGDPVLVDEDLLSLAREKPELLNYFAPVLTPEQLALVTRQVTGG